ncbi:MAG: hypothetical protein QG673_733 [Pseudomonadota bacterium]|nr:hypothetical protein [Pseudomonadota bacterium]
MLNFDSSNYIMHIFDVIPVCFPGGSITGAPKVPCHAGKSKNWKVGRSVVSIVAVLAILDLMAMLIYQLLSERELAIMMS